MNKMDSTNQSVKKRVVISMSPPTLAFVNTALELLEKDGFAVTVLDTRRTDVEEVLKTISIASVTGVLDISLSGLADAMLGGAPTLGLLLLEVAGQAGVPILLAPGGLDGVTFTSREAIPRQWGKRRFYEAAPDRILMRTDTTDNARLGRLLAEKVNLAQGRVAVALPLRGLSDLGAPGKPFSSADISMALFGNLTTHLRRDIRLYDCNVSIDDPGFALLCVEALKELMVKS